MSSTNFRFRSIIQLLIAVGFAGTTACASFVRGLAEDAQPSGVGGLGGPAPIQIARRETAVYTSPTHPNYRTQLIDIRRTSDEERASFAKVATAVELYDGLIQTLSDLGPGSHGRIPSISEKLCANSSDLGFRIGVPQSARLLPLSLNEVVSEARCRDAFRAHMLRSVSAGISAMVLH